MKCTECIHYKECRKKKDLRRVNTKCNPSSFERVQKVMTNADHIRSMTDDGLAERNVRKTRTPVVNADW